MSVFISYDQSQRPRFSDDSLEQAIEVASYLHQLGVNVSLIDNLAQYLRHLSTQACAFSQHPYGQDPLDGSIVQLFEDHLKNLGETLPVLEPWLEACQKEVHQLIELRAFYRHVLHVGHLLRLLRAQYLSTSLSEASPKQAEEIAAQESSMA